MTNYVKSAGSTCVQYRAYEDSSPFETIYLKMQKCLVLCMVLLALVSADGCPDGGMCAEGNTCCKAPSNDYKCCPLHQAECCEDHIHCCPMGTLCLVNESTCVNGTVSLPWVERVSAKQSTHLKSFRMISTYAGDEDDKICSDNSHCPPEFSCLQTTKGFGCCPVAQALSCSDGKHCCPQGHQCSTDGQSCIRLKDPVVPVMCNDGESECPGETTCCETPDGRWGCCPMPKAVCCEDKIHCCPDGSTCDIKQSKCISASNKEMPMWAKFPARIRAEWENPKKVTTPVPDTTTSTNTILVPLWEGAKSSPLLTRAKDVPCNDTKSCEDGSTCCKTEKGEWACCPLPQAVCCSDFIHCCPHGKICNLPAQTCEDPSGKSSEPWLEKVPAVPQKVKRPADVPCDSSKACPDNTTCCKTETGDWACCPLPEAVCCDDFIHCCPHGKICNLPAQTCEDPSGKSSEPWLEKVPAVPQKVKRPADVPCDSSKACPDNTTCCKTETGDWACCPLPEAVCCDDFIHCCPHGKICNVAAQTCEDPSGKSSEPWLEKVPAVPQKVKRPADVPCDSSKACPDNTTCCKTETGDWACCPLPEAVCCDDFIHCCPHGKICNVAAQTCEDPSGKSSEPWLEKVPAVPQKVKRPADVPCDSSKACPDNTTCCKTETGDWACCPLPEAVCCDDFIHCCPHGKICNLPAQTCEDPSGKSSEPWLEKVPAVPQNVKRPADVPCDSSKACPDNTTCCKTETGDWACCPLPEAVCCDDFIHCCPHGKICNLPAQTCEDPSGKSSEPWLEKVPAVPQKVKRPADVPCDSSKACPDNTTCCKTETGDWACCPLPEAVCCDDFIHCCPHGKICNLPAQTCEDPSGKSSEPWLEKVPAVPQKVKRPADVPCDPSHKCPDNTTCCKTETGDWACCPLPEAVCCEDHVHCCPHDTTCDPATLMCNGASGPIPMVGKVRAFTTPAPDHEESPTKDQGELSNYIEMPKSDEEGDQLAKIQCDSHTTCPKDTTCCFIKSTQKWGCCPLPQAVCCADGEHCCPKDYKCDVSRTTCTKGKVTIPWYNKLAAQSEDTAQVPAASLRCDAQSRCPEGSSCCKLSTGHWSCCPLRQAVCCGDEGHCCPQGYSCNLGMGTCQKLMLFQFQTVPLTQVSAPEPLTPQGAEVQCGGTFVCQDRETCCKISATTWACCPAPNAVCCEDMKHCCPTGYTCEEGRSCVQSNGFNWAHWQVFFSNKRKALRV
ncbi:granulin a isoform X2 [Esox lucius]|uniref:granulin a isoform X2 n=1 Tax=Esox lucius TaxID=8010 RepID=UPI0014773234|nr:granulin a isoform X2 [Esox lucius]